MRIRYFFLASLFLVISGCGTEPNSPPPQQVNASPNCDPDYAHCSDQSIHVVAQQIDDAM